MLDYKNCLFSQNESIETYKKIGKYYDAAVKVFVTMYETYYILSAKALNLNFERDYTSYPEEVEKMFYKIYTENLNLLDLLKPKTKIELFKVLHSRFFDDKNLYWEPKLTLQQFLENLILKYKEE